MAHVLRTARLLLRPPRPTDRDAFVRVHEASREAFASWQPPRPPGETLHERFDRDLERAVTGLASGKDVRLLAFLDDGTLVGFFNLNEIVRGAFECAFAGWSVSSPLQRRGYASEGVTGLLDLAFSPPPHGLGLHRVQANVMPHNLASLRVAEKCGLRREGLALRYLHIAGTWADHLMLAKTAEEHLVTSRPQWVERIA
jgi:ribosomal-protein-alanine N-acetyltransferase